MRRLVPLAVVALLAFTAGRAVAVIDDLALEDLRQKAQAVVTELAGAPWSFDPAATTVAQMAYVRAADPALILELIAERTATTPTLAPTPVPTEAPAPAPTTAPSAAPAPAPTPEPTPVPTLAPTPAPTPDLGSAVVGTKKKSSTTWPYWEGAR